MVVLVGYIRAHVKRFFFAVFILKTETKSYRRRAVTRKIYARPYSKFETYSENVHDRGEYVELSYRLRIDCHASGILSREVFFASLKRITVADKRRVTIRNKLNDFQLRA